MIPVNQYFLIFDACINQYHILNAVNQPLNNPHTHKSFKALLFQKCWIDTIQWHLEDLIRAPSLNPKNGMDLKKRIDVFNEKRTNMVEQIDDFFLDHFKEVKVNANAKLNTESPAWVVDKLSILALKIYHMKEQANRKDTDKTHQQKNKIRLNTLLEQKKDVTTSFHQLIEEYKSGSKIMKVYRQMKLYNDPSTNPAIYQKKL